MTHAPGATDRPRPGVWLSYLLAAATILFLLLVTQIPPLYAGNQNSYYVHGMNFAHPEFLANDWLVTTRSLHVVFAGLVAVLDGLGLVDVGSVVIEYGLVICLYGSIYAIVRYLVLSSAASRRAQADAFNPELLALLAFAALALIYHSGVLDSAIRLLGQRFSPLLYLVWIWFRDPQGLAGQYLSDSYLQPSEFSVLLLAAIFFMLRQRWYLALLMLVITGNFHFSYALHAGVLVFLMAGWVYYRGERATSVKLVLLYAVALLPLALYGAGFWTDLHRAQANVIVAFERQPHHAAPAYWWGGLVSPSTFKVVMILVAGLVAWRLRQGLLAVLLLVGFLYTVVSVAVVTTLNSPELGLLYPWRGSAYLVPLAQLTLVATGFMWLARWRRGALWLRGLLVAAICLVMGGSIADVALTQKVLKPPSAEAIAIQAARENTDSQAVLMVPPDWGNFRLAAGRAIFTDYKNPPFAGADVLEWWRRNQVAGEFYGDTVAARRRICHDEQLDDYFVMTSQLDETEQPIATAGDFTLVACAP